MSRRPEFAGAVALALIFGLAAGAGMAQTGGQTPANGAPAASAASPDSGQASANAALPAGDAPQTGSASSAAAQSSSATAPQAGGASPPSAQASGSAQPPSGAPSQGLQLPPSNTPVVTGSTSPTGASPQTGSTSPANATPPAKATPQTGSAAPGGAKAQSGKQVPYSSAPQTGGTAPDGTEPQTNSTDLQTGNTPIVTAQSSLVLVPVLVKTKTNDVVFSLTAGDFVLTDDGAQQDVRVVDDTNLLPLALAVVVETGGEGAAHLRDYRDLGGVLDAVIGAVPHRVAVIGFDSVPHLEQNFTANTDAAAETVASLHAGDHGAAILDALNYGIRLLSKQPPEYRRAVLLISETEDNGSQTSLGNAIRAVDDTNTSIYSFGFSTTHQAVKHEASKIPIPGGTEYGNTPYAPGGCMARDSDPDANGNKGVQALDCASDLVPPLRLARMAFLEARDGMRKNVPESVAQLTGGEYFDFKNGTSLGRDLVDVSNDLPNYYVLSFRPPSPHTGMHALQLRVKDRPKLELKARKAYWVDE